MLSCLTVVSEVTDWSVTWTELADNEKNKYDYKLIEVLLIILQFCNICTYVHRL